jgi:hypothetical protein
MRITVLDCKPIPPDTEVLLSRRRVFKSAGLVALGTMLPICAGMGHANAGWVEGAAKLISAAITAVDLYKEIWHVNEPTQGTITFINRNDYLREGDLWLAILNSLYNNGPYDDVEAQNYLPFSVPANRMITYGFNDGPYGRSPGQKIMEGRTTNASSRASMTVEL